MLNKIIELALKDPALYNFLRLTSIHRGLTIPEVIEEIISSYYHSRKKD